MKNRVDAATCHHQTCKVERVSNPTPTATTGAWGDHRPPTGRSTLIQYTAAAIHLARMLAAEGLHQLAARAIDHEFDVLHSTRMAPTCRLVEELHAAGRPDLAEDVTAGVFNPGADEIAHYFREHGTRHVFDDDGDMVNIRNGATITRVR